MEIKNIKEYSFNIRDLVPREIFENQNVRNIKIKQKYIPGPTNASRLDGITSLKEELIIEIEE